MQAVTGTPSIGDAVRIDVWRRRVGAADRALFDRIADLRVPGLDRLLPRLSRAADRSALWVVIGVVLALLGGRRGRRAALRGLTALAITSATVNVPVKFGARRRRPPLDRTPVVRRLQRQPTTWSFPSGHAASAAAFATGATLEDPRLALPLGLLAVGVAASRVYVGVHYPGDVAVGTAIGAGAALATSAAWPRHPPTRARAASARVEPRPTGNGCVIVVNVEAGSPVGDVAARLRSMLPDAEIAEVDPGSDDLAASLEDAAGRAEVLGVAGGDGTIATAAEAAIAADAPLLVVPAGTRNHFAGTLGMSRLEDAREALRSGRCLDVDVGEIAGRCFVNAASIGGYPEMVEIRERLEDRIGKWPATAVGLGRILRTEEPIEVELDGRPLRAWLLVLGNCAFTPAGYAPTRRDRLDDGVIDVRVIRAEPTWARLRAAVGLLTGRLGRSGAYEQRLVSELTIRTAEAAVRVARDGETFVAPPTLRVGKRRGVLRVLVPGAGG